MGQPLPPREAAIFKRIIKYYELKQYKLGLKAAKLILDKKEFANHGETLAMKGLTLNCLDRKEEAYDYVRRGLRNDLKSHVCWHVYGLLHRSDKNYTEAIKSYRNALKFDPENMQILRDLSLLQIHIRDLEGYVKTRHVLLQLRGANKGHWIGYAVALHLAQQYSTAIKVLDAYQRAQLAEEQKEFDYERSELILYKAEVLLEMGEVDAAIRYLELDARFVYDQLSLKQLRAKLYFKANQLEAAAHMYRSLLDENPEDASYYAGLEECLGYNDSTPQEERLAIYQDMSRRHPRAHTPKRLPLAFTTGETFESLLDAYLWSHIQRGVTPVFRSIAVLYESPEKIEVISKLVKKYMDDVEAQSKSNSADRSPPSYYVWTLLFAAQHEDKLGNHVKGLEIIQRAIDHTPTVLELYMAKAKLLKHAGDIPAAAECLDFARELDTADRYINSKAVKYQLRAGLIEKAEENVSMFTREASEPIKQLTEMQCMWFEYEESQAFVKSHQLGKALKKLHAIEKHFQQFTEDEFDFHSYCLRKMTLRSYVRLVKLEDRLRGHRFYERAALLAISVYVGLHDRPYGSPSQGEEEKLQAMTEADRRKYLRKQKKAEQRAQTEKANKAKETGVSKGAKAEGTKADSDPDGEELAKTKTPLEEAIKFLIPLQRLSPNLIEGHFAAFEIYSRKGKLLLMLQALKRAIRCDAKHPKTQLCRLRFLKKVSETKDIDPVVRQVIEAEIDTKVDLAADNKTFAKENATSLPHVAVALELSRIVDPKSSKDLEQAFLKLTDPATKDVKGRDLKTCTQLFDNAKSGLGLGEEARAKVKSNFAGVFPLAALFQPPKAEKAEQ